VSGNVILREVIFRVECREEIRDEIQDQLLELADDLCMEPLLSLIRLMEITDSRLQVSVTPIEREEISKTVKEKYDELTREQNLDENQKRDPNAS